jgi:hypothetical protein
LKKKIIIFTSGGKKEKPKEKNKKYKEKIKIESCFLKLKRESTVLKNF